MTLFRTRSSTLTVVFGLLLFLSGGFLSSAESAGVAGNLSYTYDELNRLTRVVYPNGSIITYSYDAAGNRLSYHGTLSSFTLIAASTDGGFIERVPDRSRYLLGEQVALTPIAAPGYQFTGWSGDASGNENPLTVVVDGNNSVTGNFSAIAPDIGEFRSLITGTDFEGFRFLSSTRFQFVGDDGVPYEGEWFYGQTGADTGTLTFVYDGELPEVYREEVRLFFETPHFGAYFFTAFEDDVPSEETQGTFAFDRDFFQLPRTPGAHPRDSFWFGQFNDEHFDHDMNLGWIRHREHGWLYAAGRGASESLWLWDHIQQDWLWTRVDLYPFFFSHDYQNWLYYHRGGNPRSRDFFDYRADEWIKVQP